MSSSSPWALRLIGAALACWVSLADAAPPPAPGSPPPGIRLGNAVEPLVYDAELVVVPREDRFTGHIKIEIQVAQTTSVIWLNAEHLEIHRAQLVEGAKSVSARVLPGAREMVGLRFAQPVPAGRATLVIDYEGAFDRADSDGVFKIRDGDDWYVYTQFEPVSARRAFPCFDEPGWKTPWRLELTVPAGLVAVSNTPVIDEQALSGSMKRVRFAQTLPLPSYLVAFAVGPFEVVDGGSAGRNAVPLRFIVPKGHAAEVRYAREVTPRLLEIIEDYVGLPYPFAKLDQLAVPVSSGFGAMENAGLITITADWMLARPDQESIRFREDYASTAAHELAHQWFGDLVTVPWWDDLWLSESFADWQSERSLRHLESGWLTRLYEDGERQDALGVDRLESTRAMRAQVATREQIDGAFDAISYEKGAALLRMLESWMGEDAFRNGVRRYLAAHAFGSARSEDLIAALAAEAGPQGDDLQRIFVSMTEQPGAPALDIALDCGSDNHGAPQLNLSQHRFVPRAHLAAAGEGAAPAPPAGQWLFPACFQYGEGADFGESCVLIHEPHQTLALPEGEKCPVWVVGNPRGVGYFVPLLSDPLTTTLLRAPLLPDEAIAVLGDARLLSQSGDMPLDRALALAARFADSRQPPVAGAAVAMVRSIAPILYQEDEDRDALARFVRAHFGERAHRLGWLPKDDERAVDRVLRTDLLPLVADLGQDASLRQEAEQHARDWLAGHLVLSDMLRPILVSAAHYGNADLFDAYLAAAARASGSDRSTLYGALGSFHDPALIERGLQLVLSEKTDVRDARLMFLAVADDPVSAPQALHLAEGHYDDLMRRLGEDGPSWVAASAARLCNTGPRRDFEKSINDHPERIMVASRELAQGLESADLCIASRAEQGARLRAFLSAQAATK